MVDRLLKLYREHGKIIVGVDFDDTIFPFNDWCDEDNCANLRGLLRNLKGSIILCLYTSSDSREIKYKLALMQEWGITPDYINSSPVKFDSGKPYFNILLDDKAGLNEATQILNQFNNKR